MLGSPLKDMCENSGYSLRNLTEPGTVLSDSAASAVTFVENHDIIRDDAIIVNKMLAYAYILTHEGYPCVFWQDYFDFGLALEGQESGISALVNIHEQYAGGTTSVLYVDDNLYIMQRSGFDMQKGLIFVLNNRESWNGTSVKTEWINTKFVLMAWRGVDDTNTPQNIQTDNNGLAQFWAPTCGYCVYVPV